MLIICTTIKGKRGFINMQYVQDVLERSADQNYEHDCLRVIHADSSELLIKGSFEDFVALIYPPEKGKSAPELKFVEPEKKKDE